MYHKTFSSLNFPLFTRQLVPLMNDGVSEADGLKKLLNKRTCILQFIKFNGTFFLIDFFEGDRQSGWREGRGIMNRNKELKYGESFLSR